MTEHTASILAFPSPGEGRVSAKEQRRSLMALRVEAAVLQLVVRDFCARSGEALAGLDHDEQAYPVLDALDAIATMARALVPASYER
ncbi:MAG: hypothetical protein M3Q48_14755 [Actinomycetota bacterium]|nr:hypothetical protein [Actinomycetota bacterium]